MWRAPLVLAAVAACSHPAPAPAPATPAATQAPSPYEAWEVKVPMRDGVHLRTLIFAPRARKDLPFILWRDPYGIPEPDPAAIARSFEKGAPYVLADGYILVFQLDRGHGGSEGEFIMMRPARDRADPKATDESTDTYDTITWLLANVSGNNGRAGLAGASYSAFTAIAALTEPHPAIKAVLEGASPADMFLNDDFHHNGAFRLYYGFQFVHVLEHDLSKMDPYDFKKEDLYDFFMRYPSAAALDAEILKGGAPTWNAFMEHPDRDEYWRVRAVPEYLHHSDVPVLHVAGWYDQEDFVGPLRLYRLLEDTDKGNINHLLVGPWNHTGWYVPMPKLGGVDFGGDPSLKFAELEARWWRALLHGDGAAGLPEATVFETGTNVWHEHTRWPPAESRPRRLYLAAGGALADKPGRAGADAYVSDPASPVPFRPRPVEPFLPQTDNWAAWMVADQRFLAGRPDVLTWSTPPLAADGAIAGVVTAELYAETDHQDADWVVKLLDVAPDGTQLIVSADILRGRYRGGFDRPRPVRPGEVVRLTIDLHDRAHVFLRGHAIAVQVQSTWFPLIDRNPQKWVANIYRATAADFAAARHRIHRGGKTPSAIVLPWIDRQPTAASSSVKASPQ